MTDPNRTTGAPIILVPGFWLGAWAWDEVAAELRSRGHDVTALTLPGLEPDASRPSSVTLEDHVRAICDAVAAADAPVVLAVHSGTGYSGYAASDRLPDRIAAMVYVDSAPGISPMNPDFEDDEQPLVWEALVAEESLDGLSEAQLETFRNRAVPEPGGVLRGVVALTNDARRDIPSTILCTSFPSEQIKAAATEQDWPWLAGVKELRNVTWIDVPTSHWPMWSRPEEVVEVIAQAANRAS